MHNTNSLSKIFNIFSKALSCFGRCTFFFQLLRKCAKLDGKILKMTVGLKGCRGFDSLFFSLFIPFGYQKAVR